MKLVIIYEHEVESAEAAKATCERTDEGLTYLFQKSFPSSDFPCFKTCACADGRSVAAGSQIE